MNKKSSKSSKKTFFECNTCGQNLKPGIHFCPKCGAKVDNILIKKDKDQHLYNKFKIETPRDNLFDTNRNLFVFDIKNSLILNEDNIIVGSFEVIDKLLRYKINVYSTKKLEFILSPKLISVLQSFKIKSNKKKLIAKIRKKLLSFDFYDLEVISPSGEKWFRIKSSKNFKSTIKSNITNKVSAIFGPIKSFKNFIFNLGVKDPKYLYILKILDRNSDIRLLISIFIVYYIQIYSKYF